MEEYIAGWNVPGYLPETKPEKFETLEQAREYLVFTLAEWLDDDDAPLSLKAEDIIETFDDYAEGHYQPFYGPEIVFWAKKS